MVFYKLTYKTEDKWLGVIDKIEWFPTEATAIRRRLNLKKDDMLWGDKVFHNIKSHNIPDRKDELVRWLNDNCVL